MVEELKNDAQTNEEESEYSDFSDGSDNDYFREDDIDWNQASSNYSARQENFGNNSSKINSVNDHVSTLSRYVNNIKLNDRFEAEDKSSIKDKSDRATSEQVLDPRTRMILLKLINNGTISEINGCISTGKEANVYHATNEDGKHFAIKIYKTSILVFKDRDRYVSGEFRFRHGYNKRNPRKMVRLWAEKEIRNLKRVAAAGIPCPEPILLKQHVLLMSFLGDKKGWAYPKLKDIDMTPGEATKLYQLVARNMRILFHVCHLVHADLSEYNLLYHKGKVYFIDVSQSVEHDHPQSIDFLRMDILNISTFFRRLNAGCLSLPQLFKFITEEGSCEKEAMKTRLNAIYEEEPTTEEYEEEFLKTYVPRTLDEVYDIDRDTEIVNAGGVNSLVYKHLLNTDFQKLDLNDTTKNQNDQILPNETSESDDDANSISSMENEEERTSDSKSSAKQGKGNGRAKETPEEKRARKKKTKEDKAEKRKSKIPKYEKKRKLKQSGRKK
ncbi:Serine/threonine-protein kinase rio1 [Schizosaccharomyces pombe]|uniref:Serine/threonine-protein kinase rio1 n=1 Tax=Schizosaccharomyces pombe (strain 972 / ATCC 24843) TaxID=284812 RepID=RIO1_SCHPO|nr:putative RIO family protein kinase [Schizosaccharomyces pombe]O42650.2 RecName: Full=Serine/threonine-protein kinase rio1 [Schizosaccharomyces pombe 972h-]CAA15723.2 protein kinase, RIO family (predicted) [Schizosaccharomyces pombe]|eukprot:NP_593261.2 putative RIO family protein kinase [Schizosaccharomyces pombe]